MSIFISHSFEDTEQFDNIADALDREQVPYWKPSEIVAGAALSDQLRDAIGRSHIGVFIATRNSVNSSWCNAELGAFYNLHAMQARHPVVATGRGQFGTVEGAGYP